MYEKLSKLTDSQINMLTSLKQDVPMSNKYIRLGESGTATQSVYYYSKWSTWNREQKNNFKTIFTEADINKSVVGWFLNFPANTGFLDKMIAWQGQEDCGTVISYALDAQIIYIDDQPVNMLAGEGIKFKLNHLHEIKTSPTERNWACIMVMI